jgi:hypothetical protein
VKNIGLDAAGTGIGSFAGAKAGATIGTAVAPGMGSVVGAIIGGISGAFAGRSISNRIKFSQAESARSHYEKKIQEFQERVTVGNTGGDGRPRSHPGTGTVRPGDHRIEKNAGTRSPDETPGIETAQRLHPPPRHYAGFLFRCEADIRKEAEENAAALREISFAGESSGRARRQSAFSFRRNTSPDILAELVAARSALLDPACSLGDVERTEVCMELFAAFGGHEEDIRKHLIRYNTVTTENLTTLIAWPPGAAPRAFEDPCGGAQADQREGRDPSPEDRGGVETGRHESKARAEPFR